MRKKLGELLVERGLVDRGQLQQALDLQRRNGMRLGVALVSCGHIDESQLTRALGELLGIPTLDLDGLEPEAEAVEMVSARFAAEHDVFPVRLRRDRGRRTLTVAMSDPMDMSALDELGFMTNARVEAVLASASDVDRAIRQVYGPRLAGAVPTHPLALRQDASAGRMTILRRGGGEEEIDTGSLAAPVGGASPEPPTADLPVVGPAEPSGPILLTEEVQGGRSVARAARPAPGPRSGPRRPVPPARTAAGTAGAPASGAGPSRAAHDARNASTNGPVSAGPTPASDFALGALVGPAGQAVDAEAFVRLERRVWAILRILSRKGLITKEEFMRELGEEHEWS
jgi:hypothetical protein